MITTIPLVVNPSFGEAAFDVVRILRYFAARRVTFVLAASPVRQVGQGADRAREGATRQLNTGRQRHQPARGGRIVQDVTRTNIAHVP